MKDKPTIRISSIGYCPRKLSAMMLGVETDKERPAYLETAAEEGKWHEARIKKELAAQGLTIKSQQICDICARELHEERNGIHVDREYSDFVLMGHMDGIVLYDKNHIYFNDDRPRVMEVKSMSQYEFDRWMRGRWEAFPQYADQLTTYMYIYNESIGQDATDEALYIVKNRNSGYKDIFVQRGFPSDYHAIMARVEDVVKFAGKGKLYPSEFDSMSLECKRCEFKSICLPENKEQFTILQEEEALSAAKMWREGKAEGKLADEKVKAAEEILKGHVRANSQGETEKFGYRVDGLSVTGFPTKEAPVSYVKKAGYEVRVMDTRKADSD